MSTVVVVLTVIVLWIIWLPFVFSGNVIVRSQGSEIKFTFLCKEQNNIDFIYAVISPRFSTLIYLYSCSWWKVAAQKFMQNFKKDSIT